MDKIFIHALKTETIVGIFDWERQVKQTVLIDIEFSADIRKAALSDSIEDTLNYKGVAKRVLAFVEESSFHLVETLAEHIAMLLLEEFGVVQHLGGDLDRADLGARLGDLHQHALFLGGVALDGVDQVRDQVSAALILVHDLGPGGFDALVLRLQGVVTAA